MDEHANSFWCLLPRDILWLILQLMDYIDFHNVSAVCKNWKLACKNYCPPTPNDPIPWLLANYDAATKSTVLVERRVRVYRPLTNKIYKINLPDIGSNCHCLHSKDAWLLLHFIESVHLTNRLVLRNLFTLDKIDIPTPKLRVIVSCISQGTFSTISKSPNCVIFVAKSIRTRTRVIYAWKIGSNTWKTYQLHWEYYGSICWLYDHLYYFSVDKVMVFDNDLNLKRSHNFTFWIDGTFNITESDQELYAVSGQNSDSDSYKFDRATLDWAKVNVRILIGFKNGFNCNIGFMVREQWDEVFLQMKNLKNHGCQIMRKGEQVIVDVGHENQVWVNLR